MHGCYHLTPGKDFDVSFEGFRGISCFESSYEITLVEASFQRTIDTLFEIINSRLHLRDCYNRTILPSSKNAFVVFKLVDHNWIYISELAPQIIFSALDLCRLSELGSCKVIHFENGSSDGTVNLSLFNSGILAEQLEFVGSKIRGYEGSADDNIDSLLDRLQQAGEPIITDHYYRCINTKQELDSVQVVFDAAGMASASLKMQGAFAPCITWDRLQTSQELKIAIKNLDDQKIQRLDYVEVNEARN
ncbi:hypothetical protein SPB21_05930 [Leptothoe sp. ISB3NOV94-8A]